MVQIITEWKAVFTAPIAVALVSSLVLAVEPANSDQAKLSEINALTLLQSADTPAETGLEQITSVSQLTDVKPTDWAFAALQSLIERYGCIAGYPDTTFRGNNAMTRYEFATGLNACLDRVKELIAAGTADFIKIENLETVKKLQEEFSTELTALRGRVDKVEAKTANLEQHQFSTTTKLNGLVWFNLTGATTARDVQFEALSGFNNQAPDAAPDGGVRLAGRNPDGTPVVQKTKKAQTTFSYLTWLTLNTSFTGKDSLVIQLASGNGISPYNQFASAGFYNAGGVPYTDQTGGSTNGKGDVVIRDLFYSFPVSNNVQLTLGPRINWYRFFDFNRFTFFLNGASSFDSSGGTQVNAIDRGSGVVAVWQINKQLRLATAYLGENMEFLPGDVPGLNTSSNPQYGLFGGSNTSTVELTYSPSDKFNLRLGYNYSRLQAVFGQVGGAVGEPLPYGQVDAGPGATTGLNYATAHTLTVNFDWMLTPRIGMFGRYGYGATTLRPINQVVNTQSLQVGLGFPDLGKKGSLGVVTFVIPMDILQGRKYFVSGGGDGGTQYELEAAYFYPISDRISLVPAFYAIFNPNNFDSNPTVYVGNLRTQFNF